MNKETKALADYILSLVEGWLIKFF
jgi:hypothetical protein